MKLNCTNILISILPFFLLVLFRSMVSAGELKSGELNYAMVIPDDWTVIFTNSSGCSIASQDKKKTVTLLIQTGSFKEFDSNSIAVIEQELLKAGCTKVSSRRFTIGGVPAFEIVQRMGKPPFASSFVDQIVILSNKLYNLEGLHIGGTVTQDADMQKVLASFHFLHPPKPSDHSDSGKFPSLKESARRIATKPLAFRPDFSFPVRRCTFSTSFPPSLRG